MSKRDLESVILSAYLLESSSDDDFDNSSIPPRKRRAVWTKKWLMRRAKEGFCSKLLLELRTEEPHLHTNFLRMSATQFDLVKPIIEKEDTNMRVSISAEDRLVLTLRYLATGEHFRSLQYLFRIPQPTISAIVPEVLEAIYTVLGKDFIKIPKDEAEWEEVSKRFDETWQFPNCISAVDGKHVVMVTT